MGTLTIVGLFLFALLLATGQVLFKLAAREAPLVRHYTDLLPLLASRWLWLALALYGAGTVLWVLLLQRVPLSRAYPYAALGFVIVPAAGALLFGERITVMYVTGALLIAAGILMTSASQG